MALKLIKEVAGDRQREATKELGKQEKVHMHNFRGPQSPITGLWRIKNWVVLSGWPESVHSSTSTSDGLVGAHTKAACTRTLPQGLLCALALALAHRS